MIKKFDLYCPNSKRKVHIQVSIPKTYDADILFDSLYMFDGQNIFKDHDAAFGRSLRMGKYLAIMASKFNKRICGIAISNSGSDLGRINEYTPFKLEQVAEDNWKKQDVNECTKFTMDFIFTIIPYIQAHFPVKKEASSTFVMGSSLGGLYASYVANLYPNIFGAAGLFSPAIFLCDKAFYHFVDANRNDKLRNFIYVGLKESSDGSFDENLYYNTALKLHNYNKKHNIPSKLLCDYYGIHNEETWERHILQFLSYIYFDDIEVTL